MQSTIDMLNFWQDSKECAKQNIKLDNPYDLGAVQNFQVHFRLIHHA